MIARYGSAEAGVIDLQSLWVRVSSTGASVMTPGLFLTPWVLHSRISPAKGGAHVLVDMNQGRSNATRRCKTCGQRQTHPDGTDLSDRSERACERGVRPGRERAAIVELLHVVVTQVRERGRALAEEYLRDWLVSLSEVDGSQVQCCGG